MLDEKKMMENETINEAVDVFLDNPNNDDKNVQMETYYGKLRNSVENNLSQLNVPPIIRKIIFSAPDLFYLVWKLTFEPEIEGNHKRKVAYALLYFLSPIDIIPDFIPGFGVVDDVIVVCYVLNALFNDIDEKYIEQYWHGDEKLLNLVKAILREIDNIRQFVIDFVKNPLTSMMKEKSKK